MSEEPEKCKEESNMDEASQSDWRTVGEIDPRKLVEARTQLHWAVQPVMAFADCALEHASDDSQANLGWSDDLEALVGRQRPDGFSAGLRIRDMTLMVFDERQAIAESVSLEGQTIDSAVSWLEEVVAVCTGAPIIRPIRIRDYEMPAHPVAEGAAFVLDDPPAFAELARWFTNGNLVLTELTSSDEDWAEVRCWPHHFDLGTIISLESSGDTSSGRSIGVGMSPGDASYPEPYLYVNPYGLADPPTDGPALESGGRWHKDGWFGAVLTATSILDEPDDTQESAILLFLHGAVDAARNLLTAYPS
jgi:hypothetical protein